MFSYRRSTKPIKVDTGSFTVLTVAMLHHEWCPVALTTEEKFHAGKYFGFRVDSKRIPDLQKTLADRPHILALDAHGQGILIIPAPAHFDDESKYREALSARLEYPSLKGSAPITTMQPKIKKLVSFNLKMKL